MGIKKRLIYSTQSKHRWHLSYSKVKKLNKIYAQIEKDRENEHIRQD